MKKTLLKYHYSKFGIIVKMGRKIIFNRNFTKYF